MCGCSSWCFIAVVSGDTTVVVLETICEVRRSSTVHQLVDVTELLFFCVGIVVFVPVIIVLLGRKSFMPVIQVILGGI